MKDSGFFIFIVFIDMRFFIVLLMLVSLRLHSQKTIDMLYEIESKSKELELSLSKYEKQDKIGKLSMVVGIAGSMTGRVIIYNLNNIDESKRNDLYRINFLVFTPISIFGVFEMIRAPRHIKKYMY